MSKKGVALYLAVFLVCVGISVWSEEEYSNRVVSEKLIAQIDPSSWMRESFKVSPDSKRVAYVTQVGDKQFVVVNGKEGKQYDGIWWEPIFSPDSKRLAYVAVVGTGLLGTKLFVVVGGKEGKQYDALTFLIGGRVIIIGGGRIIFDSPDSFHYLAGKGNGIYLVGERIE